MIRSRSSRRRSRSATSKWVHGSRFTVHGSRFTVHGSRVHGFTGSRVHRSRLTVDSGRTRIAGDHTHASSNHRLDHCRRHPRHLLCARVVHGAAGRAEHLRVFRLGARGAVVAGRPLDGGHHVQQRHAESRHRHRPPERRRGELGVVGVRADRRVDRLLLRAALATFRRDDRPRVLRDPVLRHAGEGRARVSRDIPRPAVQLHDHGDGESCRVQDCRGAVRPGAMADAVTGWRAERGLRGALGTLGRARHRHDPVLRQDDGRDGRGLLRRHRATGRRPPRAHREAVGDTWSRRIELSQHPAGLLEQLGRRRRGVHHADRGAVVGGLVSRRGAWRRKLRGAADACVEIGARRAGRGAVLQRRTLRAPPVAVDSRRPRVASRISATRRHPEGVPESRSAIGRTRHRVPGDAEVPARRVHRPDGRWTDRGELVDDPDAPQLGRVVSRPRFLSTIHSQGCRRASLRPRRACGDDHPVLLLVGARLPARYREERVRHHPADRRWNRTAVPRALVLVARERVVRDRRDDQLVPHVARAADAGAERDGLQHARRARHHRHRDNGVLDRDGIRRATNGSRGAAGVLPESEAVRTGMGGNPAGSGNRRR